MRGLIAGALFGAEIYVPYLLIAEYDFSPTWAGLGLTAAALAVGGRPPTCRADSATGSATPASP